MSKSLRFAALNCSFFFFLVGCSLTNSVTSGNNNDQNIKRPMEEEASQETDQSEEIQIVTERYKPGTYIGEAMGQNGVVTATVTITADSIEEITIDHNETETIINGQDQQFLSNIIENNQINVDNISGATITSEAIKEAISIAITEAR